MYKTLNGNRGLCVQTQSTLLCIKKTILDTPFRFGRKNPAIIGYYIFETLKTLIGILLMVKIAIYVLRF